MRLWKQNTENYTEKKTKILGVLLNLTLLQIFPRTAIMLKSTARKKQK